MKALTYSLSEIGYYATHLFSGIYDNRTHVYDGGMTQLHMALIDGPKLLGETHVEYNKRIRYLAVPDVLTLKDEKEYIPIMYAIEYKRDIELIKILIPYDYNRVAELLLKILSVDLDKSLMYPLLESFRICQKRLISKDKIYVIIFFDDLLRNIYKNNVYLEVLEKILPPDYLERKYDGGNGIHLMVTYGINSNFLTRLFFPEVKLPYVNRIHYWQIQCDEIFKMIIKPEGLTTKDFCGRTPLHLAISYRFDNIELIKLLKTPAVLKIQDDDGNTPLHTALYSSFSVEIIKLLIAPELLTIQNNRGETPLYIAVRMKINIEIIKLLITPEVLIATSIFHSTPLHSSFTGRYDIEIIKLLITQEALTIKNDYDNTPLHLALQNKCGFDIIALLITQEILTVKNYWGKTPLQIASKSGYDDSVIKLLL